jgi:tetratricopeptide (TPR) repeat protein
LSLLGKYEEAIEMTTAAITVNPLTESLTDLTQITQILSLWVARGFAFIKMSRFVEAMSDFNHVTALVDQPHYQAIVPRAETAVTEAYRLRNICLSYYGDHLLNSTEILKAIAIYDEAITVAGGEEEVSVNVLFNRAYGFYQLAPTSADYLDKAIAGFQAVVKRDPNHLQGQTGLGQALLNKADAMATGTGLLPSLSPPPPPPPLTLSFRRRCVLPAGACVPRCHRGAQTISRSGPFGHTDLVQPRPDTSSDHSTRGRCDQIPSPVITHP